MEKDKTKRLILMKILNKFLVIEPFITYRCSFCENKATHHLLKETVFPAGRNPYYLITPKSLLGFCDECYKEFRNLRPLSNIEKFRKSKFAEHFTFKPIKLKERTERLLIRIWTRLFDEMSIDYAILHSWEIAEALCYVPRGCRDWVINHVLFVESSKVFRANLCDTLDARGLETLKYYVICLTPQAGIRTRLRLIAHAVLEHYDTLNTKEVLDARWLSRRWLRTGIKF